MWLEAAFAPHETTQDIESKDYMIAFICQVFNWKRRNQYHIGGANTYCIAIRDFANGGFAAK